MEKKANLKAVDTSAPEEAEISLLDQVFEGASRAETNPEREILSRINANLRAVVKAVGKWKADGEVTIQIKVQHDDANGRVRFQVDTRAKVPTPSPRTVVMYADETGSLHEENPRQCKMFDK
jgi:porphobilinogen deaminase